MRRAVPFFGLITALGVGVVVGCSSIDPMQTSPSGQPGVADEEDGADGAGGSGGSGGSGTSPASPGAADADTVADADAVADAEAVADAGADAAPDAGAPGIPVGRVCKATPTTYDLPADGVCAHGGFCQMSRLPLVGTLRTAWASSDTDVWMTGAGSVLHWDGSGWRGLGFPGIGVDRFIAGSSPSDLWFGPFFHWDGLKLEKAVTPAPAATVGMWFASANDGWAVDGTSTAYHWDGATWTPSPTGALVGLVAVHGFASNDVWVVGGPSVRHWNGAAWIDPPTPFPAGQTATRIGGAAPDDFWIAGSSLFHYVAGTWTSHGSGSSVKAIAGKATNDITFVEVPTVSRWNGTTITSSIKDATPFCQTCGSCTAMAVGTTKRHFAAIISAGSIANSCPAFALGSGPTVMSPSGPRVGKVTGHLFDLGGKPTWIEAGKLRVLGQSQSVLWGLTVDDVAVGLSSDGPNDAWVSGYLDTLGMASHWDGASWTMATLPARPTSEVGAASSTSAWVLTGTRAAYWDGLKWSDRGQITTTALSSIWGSSATDAWAAGSSGMFHWDGATWTKVLSTPLLEVRGFSPTDVIAVQADASGGSLHHWNGVAWSRVPGTTLFGSMNYGTYRDYAIFASNDVWVLAHGVGTLRASQWNGAKWTMFPTVSAGSFESGMAVGGSRGNLWLASDFQTLSMRCDP